MAVKIVIGTQNPAKRKAVQLVFPDAFCSVVDAPSDVSAQPFSDEETKTGAINRALYSVKQTTGAIGIGLEGGVMEMPDGLYLCNWGAIATENEEVYTASGARIKLPAEVAVALQQGTELGDVMDEYVQQHGVRHKEGAIGIFTNQLVSRQEMFAHVLLLLKGQWEYTKKGCTD
ncbi:DUF84 family protein [Ornithinibacillus gellani]|nr:DUF84 family protein [Ornithinibacillus gellani]